METSDEEPALEQLLERWLLGDTQPRLRVTDLGADPAEAIRKANCEKGTANLGGATLRENRILILINRRYRKYVDIDKQRFR